MSKKARQQRQIDQEVNNLRKALARQDLVIIADKIIAGQQLLSDEQTMASEHHRMVHRLLSFKRGLTRTAVASVVSTAGPFVAPPARKRPAKLRIKKVAVEIPWMSPSREERQAFYISPEWRKLRYQAILRSKGCCEACGRSRKDGIVLHVDHVKPISKFPHLKLVLSNLQVLCEDCNMGKGAWDQTDWRDPEDIRYGELKLISNDGRTVA